MALVPTVTAPDLRARLVGERVVVEPLTAEHVEGLIAAAGGPEMFRWLGVDLSRPQTLRAWAATALDDGQRDLEVPFAIRDAAGGTVLGTTRYMSLALEHLTAEIGWTWLTPEAWGTGINVETKWLLLDNAFASAGLRRVEFKTDARNERSRGALTALGASFEGVFRKHRVLPDGGVRDSAYYSIIDDDWPSVSASLRARLDAHPSQEA